MKRLSFRALIVALAAALLLASADAPVSAQDGGVRTLSGTFAVAYEDYAGLPLVVGLIDAAPYFGDAPVTLPDPADQVLGEYTGVATGGAYTLELPAAPPQMIPFDVTGGAQPEQSPGVMIFDVRLMSDVAQRGYMVPNEDNIASSLRIGIDFAVNGGALVVYAGDEGQVFPTGAGADGRLFSADDPRGPLAQGWSLVNLDSAPFTVITEPSPTLNLITTGMGDVNNYASLPCAELVPTFLDRVEATYPFTELHGVDWAALRAALLPRAQAAASQRDCELIFRDFANAVPDGHVNFYLPTLQNEYAVSLGMQLEQLTDGRIAVANLGSGGPAQQAGIRIGAIITAWNGQPIDEALNEVTLYASNASTPHALVAWKLWNLNRGPVGSQADVTYQNPGDTGPATVTLTRGAPQRLVQQTPAPPVSDNVLPSGLGYIRVEDFVGFREFQDFDRIVASLIERNVPGIIIDVRSNPGGFSQISDAMASRFFETPFVLGRMVQDGKVTFQMQVDPRPPIYTGPVAILVDADTASSGDLFAYTFQARGRGLIVGSTPSAGMAGTVSGGQYYLPQGGFIQVPTGNLLDDSGEQIVEGKGVAPDVLVPVTVESLIAGQDDALAAAEQALEAVPAQ
ncbi:MAG: PDZ domain-containing protein [Anaerolineae bacterium]|nr:PDZ domain-containing protein [Anaerolineae bacterium]